MGTSLVFKPMKYLSLREHCWPKPTFRRKSFFCRVFVSFHIHKAHLAPPEYSSSMSLFEPAIGQTICSGICTSGYPAPVTVSLILGAPWTNKILGTGIKWTKRIKYLMNGANLAASLCWHFSSFAFLPSPLFYT
jgi:hypothetical protein